MNYNEKFMENCIKARPDIFLHEDLEFKHQQYSIGGFYPDLIFEDAKGKTTVVEVQRNALDRYHLYKCLEYRDLIRDNEQPSNAVRVIVVCNAIKEHHLPILKTHNIEFIQIKEKHFLALAQQYCAEIAHEEKERLNPETEERRQTPDRWSLGQTKEFYEFQPVGWRKNTDITEYLRHFYSECGRLGIECKYGYINILRHNILKEIEDAISSNNENSTALAALMNMSFLNFENLAKRRPQGYIIELGADYAKPRIDLIPLITSKENLSVCWRPTGWNDPYQKDCDWKQWYTYSDRSPQRPIDELMFIRGVGQLDPNPKTKYGPYLKFNKSVVNAILICAVRAAFDGLVQRLSLSYDINLINDFSFVVEEIETESYGFHEQYVVGWEIYNVREREEEIEIEWLEGFESEYGLSPEIFLEIYKTCLAKRKSGPLPSEHNRSIHASRALKAIGHAKFTQGTVEQTIQRLQVKHGYLYSRFQ